MPGLRVLDYVKITETERAGGAMAIQSGAISEVSTSVVGSSSDSSSSSSSSGSGLTEEERAALKVAVTQATTKEALEVLMKALDEGTLPDGFTF